MNIYEHVFKYILTSFEQKMEILVAGKNRNWEFKMWLLTLQFSNFELGYLKGTDARKIKNWPQHSSKF